MIATDLRGYGASSRPPSDAHHTPYSKRVMAADQVAVARSNLDLANQTLSQARDRFSAGVTDTIEVVQAQGSVAIANDNLISALYAHNLAKVELARALGSAEQQIQKFMEVK